MAPWIAAALYLIDLALKIVALGVVPKNRRPSSGMAWLLLILVLPVFGWVVFLVLGRTKLGRRRNEQQAEVNSLVAERTAHVPTLEDDFPGPAYVRSVATLNRNLGAQSAMPGNRIDLFPLYAESIAAMTTEIDKASIWVHVEFYITAWDDVTGPFYEALVRAADRAVQAAAGPAQPPQDPGDRRDGGVRRFAEPDRARLQQARQPQARPGVGGAGGPRRGSNGECPQPALLHRLVQRDRGQADR
jgi:hypothetical protein